MKKGFLFLSILLGVQSVQADQDTAQAVAELSPARQAIDRQILEAGKSIGVENLLEEIPYRIPVDASGTEDDESLDRALSFYQLITRSPEYLESFRRLYQVGFAQIGSVPRLCLSFEDISLDGGVESLPQLVKQERITFFFAGTFTRGNRSSIEIVVGNQFDSERYEGFLIDARETKDNRLIEELQALRNSVAKEKIVAPRDSSVEPKTIPNDPPGLIPRQ